MTYRGHMENGVAVLEGDVRPPDGTPVEVVPIAALPQAQRADRGRSFIQDI